MYLDRSKQFRGSIDWRARERRVFMLMCTIIDTVDLGQIFF